MMKVLPTRNPTHITWSGANWDASGGLVIYYGEPNQFCFGFSCNIGLARHFSNPCFIAAGPVFRPKLSECALVPAQTADDHVTCITENFSYVSQSEPPLVA